MLKTYSSIFIFLFICSCVPNLPDKIQKEEISIPKNFPDQKDQKQENIAQKNWKLFFKDENLVKLIEIALKNNQELNILNQEISIANNEVMARQGEYLPKLGLGAGYEYEKTSKFTSRGRNDENSGLAEKLNNSQIGFNASWEVDIWKKLRNFAKSSYLEYLASIEGKKFATTLLVSEIANSYYELMALDNQLEIVEKYIKNLSNAQKAVEFQKIAGRSNSLSVKRFRAEVLKNKSQKYDLKQRITVTENHLNKLLGRLPQSIDRPSQKFTEITFSKIDLSIPSDLLNNRPDIKEASLKMEATKLNVKAVKTKFYPSLSIDASAGYASFNASHFLDTPEALFYNAAGNLTVPLLNRNAIKSQYFSANNEQIKAVYNYEKTFINAFTEVVNQLSAINNLEKSYALRLKQSDILTKSVNVSNALFKAARIDYLESLLTQRDFLEARIKLVEVKQKQLSAYVNLYKALGGGWR